MWHWAPIFWPQGGSGAVAHGYDDFRFVQIVKTLECAGLFLIQRHVDVCRIIGDGKVHRQGTLGRNGHAADDHIELSGKQRRNDTVPVGGHRLEFDAEIVGKTLGYVDFKAYIFSLFVLHGPGDERGESHTERSAFDNGVDGGFRGGPDSEGRRAGEAREP